MSLFPALAAPLSYVVASAALPLWDQTFASWDRDLGLDWMGWLSTMNNHRGLHEIFAAAYSSFLPQAAVVILVLGLAGHLLHLRLYILSFIFAALITIAISALMPAQGVWGYFHLTPSNYPNITPVTQQLHLKIFDGLRDGTFRELVARGAEGIITFPSLHTAGGWLFIFAIWPVRYLRWIFLLLDLTMIGATPVDGGHYFSDVIAGTADCCGVLDRRRAHCSWFARRDRPNREFALNRAGYDSELRRRRICACRRIQAAYHRVSVNDVAAGLCAGMNFFGCSAVEVFDLFQLQPLRRFVIGIIV